MKSKCTRREFLKDGAILGAATLAVSNPAALRADGPRTSAAPAGVARVVASANGLAAVQRAMELLQAGADPLDATVAGVNLVEDDPEDMSVGYGGLPNEDGIVELDASVMDGPTHSSGAVAAIQNIKNPSKVAKLVMERTRHCLLVGPGALRFALAHGFKEENLLTEKARLAWLEWKERLSDRDNWIPERNQNIPPGLAAAMSTYGTINCLALDDRGRLAGTTTTSGLSWKIAGRVGDSPIIGAGLYVDNAIGAAGSTGLGEANIMNLGSYAVVQDMGRGLSPEQACLKALERTAEGTRRTGRLSRPDGRPNYGLNFYAVNAKGEFGSASMFAGGTYAVHDGMQAAIREAAYLYDK
ncbi:MAG: N(4)-(beta-N-acetylglucosaminyl)-L-asparaginase [Candidatus Aminicenantes bacterium]|nr:N(4)-(beta-N-acetylglucosaminyl)-L-asparaginase [Candidatus Aminicenantes bacterium]